MNREEWLQAAVQKLRPVFLGHGYIIPELRVSVGWPSTGGLAKKKRTIGQCWFGSTAADGKPQLFISPLLDADVKSAGGVLATLVHEVVHVAAGPDAKHTDLAPTPFKYRARGLEMKTIPLTRGLVTIVEDQDFEVFGHLNWYASQSSQPNVFYAARRENGVIVLLHRLIRRALPDELVDHENGDTLDNRRPNLRLATHSQNCQNQRKGSRPMSSKFKGVCRVSAVVNATNPWLAYVGGVRGPTKRKYLGYFSSEILAARAYNLAASELFGEFARLNNV